MALRIGPLLVNLSVLVRQLAQSICRSVGNLGSCGTLNHRDVHRIAPKQFLKELEALAFAHLVGSVEL